MKSFWLGLAGSFVGIALLSGIAFYSDIFTLDKDGVPKFRVSDAGKVTIGATESYINLVIQNNATEPNNKVDITADLLVVENVRLENLSVSATITTTGAGGRDAGSEAASTWYYVWAITNNDGTSSNGLISASSTSPTMPSGFTKKRRVGAVRNDGSSNFLQFAQEGNKCNYLYGANNYRPLSAGQSTSWTLVPGSEMQKYIPPTSRRISVLFFADYVHSTANTTFNVYVRKAGSSSTGQFIVSSQSQANNQKMRNNGYGEIETDDAQQVEYYIFTAPSSSGGAYMDVLGYYDRI